MVIVRTPIISKMDVELPVTNPLSLKLPFTGKSCMGCQRVLGVGLQVRPHSVSVRTPVVSKAWISECVGPQGRQSMTQLL